MVERFGGISIDKKEQPDHDGSKKMLPKSIVEFSGIFDYAIFKCGELVIKSPQGIGYNIYRIKLIDEHNLLPQIHIHMSYPGQNNEGMKEKFVDFDGYIPAHQFVSEMKKMLAEFEEKIDDAWANVGSEVR